MDLLQNTKAKMTQPKIPCHKIFNQNLSFREKPS